MDTFLIFEVEDRLNASVCHGEVEAREIVGNFGHRASIRVHRITMDELVRDVTADFVDEDDEVQPFGGDYCHADHFGQLLRAGA